jgi:hypothetical protein
VLLARVVRRLRRTGRGAQALQQPAEVAEVGDGSCRSPWRCCHHDRARTDARFRRVYGEPTMCLSLTLPPVEAVEVAHRIDACFLVCHDRRMNLFDLEGKALVTGGNGGIGLGITKALAAAAPRWRSPGATRRRTRSAEVLNGRRFH